jgi:WD40 repeat protein
MVRIMLAGLLLWVGLWVARAQDGLNLSAELYILDNDGVLRRYGQGASGVQTVVGGGDTFVIDFAVAPDNVWLAYRTSQGLFLMAMDDEGQPPVQVEGSSASFPDIRGRGETIAWSPDSSFIAYTTFANGRVHSRATGAFQDLGVAPLEDLRWSPGGQYLAARQQGGIWWIYAVERNALRLTAALPDATDIAWLPDNRFYFTPATGGLILMDLARGNAQTTILDASTTYFLPLVRGDELLVFAGEPTNATLRSVTAQSTEQRGQIALDTTTLRWAPDGSALVAFSGGALAFVDAVRGESFTLPISSSVAYGWGALAQDTGTVTLPTDAYFLAEALSTGVTQVWQVRRTGALPQTITPAEENVTEYSLSPDGSRISYVSGGRLWYYRVGGAGDDLYEIDTIGTALAWPAINNAATRLYYIKETEGASALWYADLTSGQTFAFYEAGSGAQLADPQPSASVNALLVSTVADNVVNSVLLDAATGEQITLPVTGSARWLRGSRLGVVGTSEGQTAVGLWLVDVGTAQVSATLLYALRPGERILDYVQKDNASVRLLVVGAAPAPVRVVDVAIAGSDPVPVAAVGYLYAPRLSADGAVVLGLTRFGGDLVAVAAASGMRQRLTTTGGLLAFSWQGS